MHNTACILHEQISFRGAYRRAEAGNRNAKKSREPSLKAVYSYGTSTVVPQIDLPLLEDMLEYSV